MEAAWRKPKLTKALACRGDRYAIRISKLADCSAAGSSADTFSVCRTDKDAWVELRSGTGISRPIVQIKGT